MNKKKTLIVCALDQEVQGQLEDYNVLYTGVGKVTFQTTSTYAIDLGEIIEVNYND